MFSKYELYSTAQSLYCYPDTNVLRNRLNIKDAAALKEAEEEITALKQYALLQQPISGRFTKTHLCRIHRFLFEDIYAFAGHLRRSVIEKNGPAHRPAPTPHFGKIPNSSFLTPNCPQGGYSACPRSAPPSRRTRTAPPSATS